MENNLSMPWKVMTTFGSIPGIWQPADSDLAVIFVNGGAQTRVGPHRLYWFLSTKLAKNGVNSFRFDLPGFGDLCQNQINLFDLPELIVQICQQIQNDFPHIKRIMLTGLCDGASSILLTAEKLGGACEGIFLINPWTNNEAIHAKTVFKNYYFKKLFDRIFWKKLISGRVSFYSFTVDTFKLVFRNNKLNSKTTNQTFHANNYVEQCWLNWEKYRGLTFIAISENDLTAAAFISSCNYSALASTLLSNSKVNIYPNADHTFSSLKHKMDLADDLIDFSLNL
jgi:exosortase A-associated hydrolase 1